MTALDDNGIHAADDHLGDANDLPRKDSGVHALKAVVTGASSGIGAAVARRVVSEGGQVALLSRRADALADLAAELGSAATAISMDVSDSSSVASALDAAVQSLGEFSLVVNCAGTVDIAALEDTTDEVWSRAISVNLSGTFYVCREAASRMTTGSIVNLGSDLSMLGMSQYVAYCASKAGVIGITKALAVELAPRGIRVNAVCPGAVDTPMLRSELAWFPNPEASMASALERIPLGRFAEPNEVAHAVLFLHEASFATGTSLVLDGGTTVL